MDVIKRFKQGQSVAERQALIYKIAEEQKADTETVIETLKDSGVCAGVGRCKRCSKCYPIYLSEYCAECEKYLAHQEELGKVHEVIIEYQLQQNSAKKASLIRQLIELDMEREKLRRELDHGSYGKDRDRSTLKS